MFRSRFFLTAVVAVAAALAAPAASQAGLVVTLSQSGGPGPTDVSDATTFSIPSAGTLFDSDSDFRSMTLSQAKVGGGFTNTATFGAFSITMTASATENSDWAQVIDSTTKITNTSGSTATITITVLNDDFTIPGADNTKYRLDNSVTLNSLTTTQSGNTVAGGGYANVSAISTAADPSTPTDPVTWNNLALFTGSPKSDATAAYWTRSSTPYTLSNEITITLAAGAALNFQVVATVTPTPAPAGLVLLASAVPFLGLLRIRRRLVKADAAVAA